MTDLLVNQKSKRTRIQENNSKAKEQTASLTKWEEFIPLRIRCINKGQGRGGEMGNDGLIRWLRESS